MCGCDYAAALGREAEFAGVDGAGIAEGEGAFQYVFQFAYIAGEAVGLECGKRFGVKLAQGNTVTLAEALQDGGGKEGDVFGVFAQGGGHRVG